jgi:hypothetical protein
MIRRALGPLVVAALLSLPAAAPAAPVTLDGNPLNISTNETGQLQVRLDGETGGEFFPQSSEAGRAGFHLSIYDDQGDATLYGTMGGSSFAPVSGPVLETPAPGTRRLTVTYGAQTLRVRQVIEYRDGDLHFTVHHEVTNPMGITSANPPVQFTAAEAADLAIGTSDTGRGYFAAGPPRLVGGINEDSGAVGGIEEITSWSNHEANNLGTIGDHLGNTLGPAFNGDILQDFSDNAAGVQWDTFKQTPLNEGSSHTFSNAWRFRRFQPLTIDPTSADLETGETFTLKITSRDAEGNPAAGRSIGYQVAGISAKQGSLTTGGDGSAEFEYIGANPGSDSVTVFMDLNGNGQFDAGEPTRTATVNWTGPTAPIPFTTVNLGIERGVVRVDPPRGRSILGKGGVPIATDAAGFIRLRQAAQIPVGSLVDVRKGTVRMTSAANREGTEVQTGFFRGGVYKAVQKRARTPVTELRMTGGSFRRCPGTRNLRRGSARTAARRIRRLSGRARGRFRTRGRYGSATVRGTTWSMEDRCNGTLTRVQEGIVAVRDFAKRRTITVRAGRSYLARPRR